jgi:hypothetical protein
MKHQKFKLIPIAAIMLLEATNALIDDIRDGLCPTANGYLELSDWGSSNDECYEAC